MQMAHAWKQSQAKKSGETAVLSGFTPATSSTLASAQNGDDVQMEEPAEQEQEDSRSDVASSDGE
jgi:crooked neck